MIKKRVQQVREFRLKSTKAVTVKSADSPTLFQQIRQPDEPYIIVPRVSSENRRYIPMGYESPETIITDSVQCIPNADLYTFGIITSNVHMAWTRVVCGRLKSDYRYSAKSYITIFHGRSQQNSRNRKSKKQHMEFWMPEHFSQTVVSQICMIL